MNFLKESWRLIRPQEWVKSGFVFMGVLFANAWHQPRMVQHVLITAIAFSLTASGVYVLNDLLDRNEDLSHPTKKHRPLAARTISRANAIGIMVLLWSAGLTSGFFVSVNVLLILLSYVLINLAYSLGLKHVPILDVFIIAGGFMLRILAGTSGVGIAPSQWLMLCGLMVALFLGFAKRRAELYALSGEQSTHRRVLGSYQPMLLDQMIVITATGVILTYSLYTMSPITIQVHKTEALIYTVPFVMYGVFRYIYLLHKEQTGTEPADEIFRDGHILVSILSWLVATLWLITGR